ncbi:hypothetical protein BH20CHL6_BH20CHL6_07430 [soil metagenome]
MGMKTWDWMEGWLSKEDDDKPLLTAVELAHSLVEWAMDGDVNGYATEEQCLRIAELDVRWASGCPMCRKPSRASKRLVANAA